MTARDTGTHDSTRAVRVRAEGDVDEEALAYVRAKVDAALGRPGLPEVTGEVRVARAAAHHVERPWSAGAELRVGSARVVVHAQEASAGELADRLQDRLQDRLRGQVETAVHRGDGARRTATPPPWRGGPTDGERH
ncbi:hypothetical protein ACIBJF_49185 [Streptomyces sp. NPDC050743]|uniref:hypothetical protein n=1 Tax=Streptomyces sp. NPDC050743 TaxID=3365634 RepID=UPI0037A562F4